MIFHLLLLLGFFTGTKQTPIKGIHLTQVFPQIDQDWKVSGYDTTSASLYFLGNKVLYEFSTLQNEYAGYSLVNNIKQTSYIGYTTDDTIAVKFATTSQKNDETISKDSVFKNHWVFTVNIDNFFSKLYNIILLENLQKITGQEEKYYINLKSDTSNSCILSLKYSPDMKFSEYSFAKRLDSMSGKKLVEVKLTTFPKYFSSSNKTMAGITISYHLEKIEVPDEGKLIPYFTKLVVPKKTLE